MDIIIDKITPCLEDTLTGKLVPTVYEKAAGLLRIYTLYIMITAG